MRLLVAEKPSMAKSFAALLERAEGETFIRRDGYFEGSQYCISWCIGHLVSLAAPEAYGWKRWNLEDLPMFPGNWKYEILSDSQKQFQVLAGLMRKAFLLINGADAGREGELIFRLAALMAGCEGKPQQRLWLNSLAPADMVKAWKNLLPAARYQGLYEAALARARADWLIGMNASRGYSVGSGIRALSVGRVQTPTLALVVKRDKEIEAWQDRFYFQLHGFWRGLRFTYIRDRHERQTDFEKDDALLRIRGECEGQEASLDYFECQDRKLFPPKPFDLNELQKTANRIFGFKAAFTLSCAQNLYEAKLISYPRTDSPYLPEGMKDEAWEIVRSQATPEEAKVMRPHGESFAFFNSSKVTDHYAIIPTAETQALGRMSEAERRLFALIRSRFVQAFCKPFLFEEYRMQIGCRGHCFQARAVREMDAGFRALFRNEGKVAKENAASGERKAPKEFVNRLEGRLSWKVGERDILRRLEVERKKAEKPRHYTEATLLSAMETAGKGVDREELREAMKERGLGTPATKAAIIETLKKREYVDVEGRLLKSTSKGRELIAVVDSRVSSPEMTGEWEHKLSLMARGEYSPEAFLQEIREYLQSINASYRVKMTVPPSQGAPRRPSGRFSGRKRVWMGKGKTSR